MKREAILLKNGSPKWARTLKADLRKFINLES